MIGVCAAYYLLKEGRGVTILERGEICSGCSYGNAGWLVPSHSVPLPQPGVISRSLKWMLNPRSPFYIKPRLSLELLSWLWRFRGAANEAAVRRALPAIRDLSQASLALYDELINEEGLSCRYQQRGNLAVFKTESGYHEGLEEAHLLDEYGISSRQLDTEELLSMEPAIRPDVAGAILYEGDAHLKPDEFVNGLAARVEDLGGVVRAETEVLGLEASGGIIQSLRTSRGDVHPELVVLAAGSWSPQVVRGLRVNLPVQPAKGYSVSFEDAGSVPSMPMMLSEARVGVTPMGNMLRLAGTLELSGLNTDIDSRRVDAIMRAGDDYLVADLRSMSGEVWCGMRPLTPDNLPIIGRTEAPSNLIVATGHSMTGVTLGAVTGKLVSQIATGQPTALDPAPFSPSRFQ